MSRIIDTIAIVGASLVTGYFIYRVILPNIKDLQLPTFQFLPFPQFQFQWPQQQQQQQPISSTGAGALPPVAPGALLYDSTKGWPGVTTAASGNPKWTTEAGGVGRLSSGSGYGRVYIAVKNYNARMEGEFNYSGAVNTISLRLRSRHQEGGACENRFGGFGAAIHPDGEVEFQTESCHNLHENNIKGQIPGGGPKPGQWYRFAYSCYDSPDKKSVNFKLDFNGRTVLTGKHPSPKPYYMDEASFRQKSYIWLRSNNTGNGSIAFRNFRVVNLAPSSSGLATINSMSHQPYLYNRYYNRVRT